MNESMTWDSCRQKLADVFSQDTAEFPKSIIASFPFMSAWLAMTLRIVPATIWSAMRMLQIASVPMLWRSTLFEFCVREEFDGGMSLKKQHLSHLKLICKHSQSLNFPACRMGLFLEALTGRQLSRRIWVSL